MSMKKKRRQEEKKKNKKKYGEKLYRDNDTVFGLDLTASGCYALYHWSLLTSLFYLSDGEYPEIDLFAYKIIIVYKCI